jgi:very-short-patch-repair endonuclease
LARELRKDETEAEKRLWIRLSRNQIRGLQFRRQHPLNIFIADFYCPKIKLVVELDGSIHEISEYEEHDIGRSEILNDFGITVIRFTNDQVLNDLDGTIDQIDCIVKKMLNETTKTSK